MTIQLDTTLPVDTIATAGARELRITLRDVRSARRAGRIVETVLGRYVDRGDDGRTVTLYGVDARTSVDVLVELIWAGVPTETFVLA